LTPHHDLPTSHLRRDQGAERALCPLRPLFYPQHIHHPLAWNQRVFNLRPGHDTPGADDVVGVTGEEGLAVSGPGQRDTLGVTALLSSVGELRLQLVDLALLLEVEDDDAAGGGSAQPVSVGGEDESVDLVVGAQGVQVLGLVEVPQHGGTVLATGGAQGAVRGDGDGVDVAGVADVVGLQLAGGELPNLWHKELIASSYGRCEG
jgi:hypothetical protein